MMAKIKKELCIKALKDAYELRRPGDGGPAYSGIANSTGNAPSNESRAAYTVQVTGADRNAAAKTEPSYTSVQGRKDGRFGKTLSSLTPAIR